VFVTDWDSEHLSLTFHGGMGGCRLLYCNSHDRDLCERTMPFCCIQHLYIVATGTIEFVAKAGKIGWTSDKCCMQQKGIVPSQ